MDLEKMIMAFDGDLYGPYVRDVKVLKSHSNNIFFRIDPIYLGPFLNILSMTGVLVPAENTKFHRYAKRLCYNENTWLTVVPLRKFDFRAMHCNFDCDMIAWNNESMYVWKNYPTTRFMLGKLSWLEERIRRKVFCLMHKNYTEENVYDIVEEAYALVSDGWTMDTCVLGNQSWEVNKWSSIPLEQKMKCTECVICQDEFRKDDIVVRTCCKHNFHWVCKNTCLGLKIWVFDKANATCPKCRSNMF